MAANTPDPAMRTIATFLSEHPGLHDLDAIAEAAGVSKPVAGKVLKSLVDSKPPVVRLDQSDAKHKQWTWIHSDDHKEPTVSKSDDATTEPGGDNKTTKPEPVRPAATGAGSPAKDPGGAKDSGDTADPKAPDAPPERDADQMVMHAARTLAAATGPLTTAEIAAAGYIAAKSLHLLTALRALASHSLITCSKPFAPDATDCTWQWTGTDVAGLLGQAAGVDLADAPDSATCPTCGTVKAIPGIAKGRSRGGRVRLDGRPRLGKNELADMARAWLEQPENAGELIKPGDLVRELRAVHGDRIPKHAYGSVSKVMAKFTELDPAHKDRPALLTHESDGPLTYRIRDQA